MAGRSLTKLQEVRDEIGASADTALIVADSDDPASLQRASKDVFARCKAAHLAALSPA
jgi:hypothetical protein